MISIIAAMSENRVIGFENKIPWKLPNDMKRFKDLTTGHPVIMGHKTFKSISKPLLNRSNIVLTRFFSPTDSFPEEVLVKHSFGNALDCAKSMPGSDKIFIIGGEEVYKEALRNKLVNSVYLTFIHALFNGDAFFPCIDIIEWKVHEYFSNLKDEKHSYNYECFHFVRK